MTWTARRADPADVQELTRINAAAWRYAFGGRMSERLLARTLPESRLNGWRRWVTLPDPDAVFVAEDDNGRIGAYCGVGGAGDPEDRHADMRTGELVALYVDPALLGTEAGAVAHGAGVEHLAMSGFRYAMLWALRDDTVSRAFYASHGWRQDGTVGCHDLNRQRLNTVRYGRFLPAPFRRHRRLPGTFGPAGSPHPSMM